MRKQIVGSFGTLSLLLALAVPAGAASVVDVTYDLSGTTLVDNFFPECPAALCKHQTLLSSSMKIRYTSNSGSSMPILHGPAMLQSLTLQAQVTISYYYTIGTTKNAPHTTASLNVALVSPVAGNLLSGGTLTFGAAQIRVSGTRHCNGAQPIAVTGVCIFFFSTITSIVGPLGPYTTTGPISFAAAAGPYGGAQSTRHTVSGSIPAYAPTKAVSTGFFGPYNFATAAKIVGREILREAEGHDPKVTPIPEPGTLLLLGAATAGLALVGRATRRSRR